MLQASKYENSPDCTTQRLLSTDRKLACPYPPSGPKARLFEATVGNAFYHEVILISLILLFFDC